MSYAIQVIMIKAFSSNQFARAILYKVLFSFRSTLIIAQNLALNLNYLFLDVSEISLSIHVSFILQNKTNTTVLTLQTPHATVHSSLVAEA